jgi:recombination protein RecA
VDGERIGQGKDNARDYLKEHPEMSQMLEEKIREKLMSSDHDNPKSTE